jgi:hypothetical protein
MDHLQEIQKIISEAYKNLDQISKQKCGRSLKRRVTLQDYKGESDPRIINTTRSITVTLPADLVNKLDRYIVCDTTFNSRREAIEIAIERLVS